MQDTVVTKSDEELQCGVWCKRGGLGGCNQLANKIVDSQFREEINPNAWKKQAHQVLDQFSQ
jgi:hypothetical protein